MSIVILVTESLFTSDQHFFFSNTFLNKNRVIVPSPVFLSPFLGGKKESKNDKGN